MKASLNGDLRYAHLPFEVAQDDARHVQTASTWNCFAGSALCVENVRQVDLGRDLHGACCCVQLENDIARHGRQAREIIELNPWFWDTLNS